MGLADEGEEDVDVILPDGYTVPEGYELVTEAEYIKRAKRAERDMAFLGFGMMGCCTFIYVILFGFVCTLFYLLNYISNREFNFWTVGLPPPGFPPPGSPGTEKWK